MKVVLQRVKEASCTIDGETTGRIGTGYMILVGFCDTDTRETGGWRKKSSSCACSRMKTER